MVPRRMWKELEKSEGRKGPHLRRIRCGGAPEKEIEKHTRPPRRVESLEESDSFSNSTLRGRKGRNVEITKYLDITAQRRNDIHLKKVTRKKKNRFS